MGYISAWLCKINIYIIYGPVDMVLLLLQDIAFAILIIIWKYKFPRLEGKGSIKLKQEPMRKILSITWLDSSKDYCMFANYIYELSPLKKWHPAGYQIIESVKNKEIDRYIYGIFASEDLPEVQLHSHTFKSLELLGNPIAKLNIIPIFTGFTLNQV